jgi:hypothetical protein
MLTDPARNSRAQQSLISALQTGRAVAVTGAGLSVWAGYPTWRELIIRLADAVRDRRGGEVNVDLIVQNNQNPLHCLQKLGAEMVQRSAFEEFVRAEFRPPLQLLERHKQLPISDFGTDCQNSVPDLIDDLNLIIYSRLHRQIEDQAVGSFRNDVRSLPVARDGVPGAVVQSRSESILSTCPGNPVNGEFGPFL